MRIPSGVTDQVIYFVAVDSADFTTRETGLSTFTVYRSRNGAAAAAMTTPTVTEVDATNMPGVYKLLLDEDMTIGSGNDSEEMVFHITQASMAPVSRTIELYRPKITVGNTLDVTATGAAGIDWGNIENKTTANDLSATDIQLVDTVTTYTGNTPQTADHTAAIADIPTVAEFNARTLVAASYFDPAADTVANVTTVATCTTNSDMVAAAPTAVAIADQVWDESISTHTTPGTTGAVLADIETDATAILAALATAQSDLDTITGTDGVTLATAQALYAPNKTVPDAAGTPVVLADSSSDAIIADAVWNALTATYGGVGSYGEHVESLSAGGDATEAKQDSIIAAVITNAAGADIAADIIAVKAETALIVADTNMLQTDWVDGGRLDNLLDGAASAGDPWTTTLPGAYGAGTAGFIVGTNLDAVLSARTLASADYFDPASDAVANVTTVATCTTNSDMVAAAPTVAAIADQVWDEMMNQHTTVGSFGSMGGWLQDVLADTNELQSDDVPGLIAALNDPTAATIADAVWDEAKADHTSPPSFGALLADTKIVVDENQSFMETNVDENGIGLTNVGGSGNNWNTTTPPTVAAIADGVWDELQSAHVAAGSFGEIATEIASVLVDTNELQLLWTPGGTLDTLLQVLYDDWLDGGRLDLLLDAAGGGGNVVVSPGVTVMGTVLSDGSTIEIVRHDDYLSADGRAIVWAGAADDQWPDLTSAALTFTAIKSNDGTELAHAATVVAPTGTQSFKLELTDDDTDIGTGQYIYQVRAVLASGNKVTLVEGLLRVAQSTVE